MTVQKRGGRGVSRTVIISIIAAVVVISIAIVAMLNRPLSEEEKAAYRASCYASLEHNEYRATSLDQCGTITDEYRKAYCQAWVSGDDAYCEPLVSTVHTWCLALAYKDPETCDVLPDEQIDFCNAWIARDPGLCENSTSEWSQFNCRVTLKGDLGELQNNVAEYCGEEYVAAP